MKKYDDNWEEFKIKVDRGVPLKIDNPNMEVDDIAKVLLEFFEKAEAEAIRNNIISNSIILNSELNLTKSFYYSFGEMVREVPPMVLGKTLYLDTDKILPNNVAFALFQSNQKNELDELRNLFKKYVKTDGKSLRFKNISFKKNKEDFERIMSIICNDL